MSDYEHPDRMTNAELAEFARNEHINHEVGCSYANGLKIVDRIYGEIASRLVSSNPAVGDNT